MRSLIGLVCLGMAACGLSARGQSGTCAAPFAAPSETGMRLMVGARSAEVDLVGTDQRQIRVTCTLDDAARAAEVQIRLRNKDGIERLAIEGGPSNNVHIVIEVPRQTHLRVRVPAGEVRIKDVTGDKDIDIHAGELIVSGVNPQQYRWVDASVEIGEVRASQFSVDEGGFFRSVKRSSPNGLYRLEAHILTGEIQLN